MSSSSLFLSNFRHELTFDAIYTSPKNREIQIMQNHISNQPATIEEFSIILLRLELTSTFITEAEKYEGSKQGFKSILY